MGREYEAPPDIRVREEVDRIPKVNNGRTVRYLAGLGVGVRFGVHASDVGNLVRGITERVLYVVRDGRLTRPPRPLSQVFKRLSGIRSRLLRKVPSTPVVTREQYPGLYRGRKQLVYQKAVESLQEVGLTVADSYVNTFVKAEKVNLTAKPDPVPRVIQPRSARYNVEVGRYLKLFEKSLLVAFTREWGYPVVLKGMNAEEIGGWFARHWSEFDQPVAVGLDASRFDQHVSRAALEWEHSIYNSHFRSSELAGLLRMQLVNRGVARIDGHRIDYTVEGCRMSGDINTGMGNCLIMSSIVIAYCEAQGIDFRLANNGDDCVVFLDGRDLSRLAGLDSWFLDFGFTLTREAPCFTLEEVEFCQFRPVRREQGWIMVRNPLTAMSKDCVSLVGWDSEVEFRSWLTSVAKCGGSLTSGVPVWSRWYAALLRCGEGVNIMGVQERVMEAGMAYWSAGVTTAEVTPEARYSFYLAFGITPDEQVALEESYDRIQSLESYTPMMCDPDTSAAIDLDNPLTPLRCLLTSKPL